MPVGMAVIFQNPHQLLTDREVYADTAASLTTS